MTRKTTDADFAELREMNDEYERLTGAQGFIYACNPTETGPDRFVFAQGAYRGPDAALNHMRNLLNDARATART